MEPYRAFVGDKLPDDQLTYGYQMQSLFVGAGITLANLSLFAFQHWFSTPVEGGGLFSGTEESVSSIPTWVYYSFFLGALASIGTILWSVWKTPEGGIRVVLLTDDNFSFLQSTQFHEFALVE